MTLVTLALGLASCLCALCIGTSAAVLTLGFALVASTLLCANCLFASCICALAAIRTNALTLVSVTLALLCALGLIALGCALTALSAYVSTRVRCLGEGDAGNGHLRTDCTVGKEESTGKVAVAVRSNNKVFACLTGVECLCKVSACGALGCINDTCLVLYIIVLAVRTVVNTNYLTVLVKDECFTPTVCPVKSTLVCRSVNYEEIGTENAEILVDRDLLGKSGVSVVAYHYLNEIVNNVNNSGNGCCVCSVGSLKSYGVGACCVNVEVTVIYNLDLNGCIVGGFECTVIVCYCKTLKNCSSEIELGVCKVCKNLIVMTGDYGSLVNVGSDNLSGISPKETYNVAYHIDYVVVHKATTVVVNGSAAIAVLNNDCITACGNSEILCERAGNRNCFAVDFNSCNCACCTVGISSVNELCVCAVTALNNYAVCVNNSCNTVLSCNSKSDLTLCGVEEHAADCCVGYVIACKNNVLIVLEVKKVAFPLGLTKSVSSNLESKSRKCLNNCDGTGSGCFLTELVNCLVGDGVNALDTCVEVIVIIDYNSNVCVALVGNANTKEKIDLVTCVNFDLCLNNVDNRSSLYSVALTLVSTSGFSALCVCTFSAGLANALASVLCGGIQDTVDKLTGRKSECQYQNDSEYCQNS